MDRSYRIDCLQYADWPDSAVEWMRVGRRSGETDCGEGSRDDAGFHPMPSRFRENRDFGNIEAGPRVQGPGAPEIVGVTGENRLRRFDTKSGTAGAPVAG